MREVWLTGSKTPHLLSSSKRQEVKLALGISMSLFTHGECVFPHTFLNSQNYSIWIHITSRSRKAAWPDVVHLAYHLCRQRHCSQSWLQ